MNQALQPVKPQTVSRNFLIEMLGFPDAEKAMLASTIRLTGRREFSYVALSAPDSRPDLYLVNADNPDGFTELQSRSPNIYAPAVLIGCNLEAYDWPLVEKPIHWMRLFDQLDLVMQSALLERARRQYCSIYHWDGRTNRRAIDQTATPKPLFIESQTIESVLVVDDSATVRAFMRTRLQPFGFDVDFAENGKTAIDMAQVKAYACIFLDIMMPGIDGYAVCKRIKSSSATKNTAVVMLSSQSSPFDKFLGNWAECDANLGTPVDENELLATIARFLPNASKVAHAILGMNS